MPRPQIVVASIADLAGLVDQRLYGYAAPRAAWEAVRLDPDLRAPLVAEHLAAYDATLAAWRGAAITASGQLDLDAAE